MRLWHIDLLEYLPRTQLLAQWRELNSVFAKQDRHVLINYIYDYPKADLFIYSKAVIEEMTSRGYKIRTVDKYERYFGEVAVKETYKPFARHHNDEYFEICYFNLKEKYIRGQKDYEAPLFLALQQQYDNKKLLQ